jgi:hypothetical protein
MKLTTAVALVTGFVLAMALAFGGRALNGPHIANSNAELMPAGCCARTH